MYDRKISTKQSNAEHNTKCNSVKDNLQKFVTNIKAFNHDYNYIRDDLRIMIGHCPQMMGNIINNSGSINSTFTNIINENNIYQKLSGTVTTGTQNIDTNLIFGIGMECRKSIDYIGEGDNTINEDNNERYIYKVDVGSMRGFDGESNPITRATYDFDINYDLISRLPQVLEMQNNNISIIRSTIRNTRINQPRWKFETHVNNKEYRDFEITHGKRYRAPRPIDPPSNLYISPEIPPPIAPPIISPTTPSFPIDADIPRTARKGNHNYGYRSKYLKYKKKYLELYAKYREK